MAKVAAQYVMGAAKSRCSVCFQVSTKQYVAYSNVASFFTLPYKSPRDSLTARPSSITDIA